MPFVGEWCKIWIYFGFVFAWARGARPRFDTSTDMGLVLVPADAEVDSVIFRLRATDQDADFPLVFEITATITPVVRIDNLPCTLYNKVCQANVILTKRLIPGRLHDFAVRVRDTKGDSNSMQATISVTNATTPRDKIFPHIPSLIMVPEDTKPGKELDYVLVRANSWSGKPVYIELWQPKELFTIRQRQTPTQTRGMIVLTGELDFETQSMYTLTMYATDPYTEQGKDTRNIAGLSLVVIVQDVQDVPPIFTLAPPLTRINNSVHPGDVVLRVHAEDGDKGVPREVVYGLVSEGNPFTPFFNISETSGEITLARPLEELTQITHVGAPVVVTVVAEEIRRSRDEPPAQATVVDVGFLLGEPGNSPPYFESDNYVATIDENPEPGTVINFGEQYITRVRDEDIGKAGVFALKLENNNNTFEISPTVAERTADFVITVRDDVLIDYELYKDLSFKIVAQEIGPATNLSTSVPVTIFLRDVNDNPPVFEEESYEVTLSENVTAGSRVVQVHATDKDTGIYGSVRYTSITGEGSEAFTMDPDTGLITVAMGSSLDREIAARLVLSVEARDENGNGNRGIVPLIVNLLDVNDNAPVFEKEVYEFMLNSDLTNFTSQAFIKAVDNDAEAPNNVVRYELIHGNYENKFYLNETSGELILRSPITKIRRKKQSAFEKSKKSGVEFIKGHGSTSNFIPHANKTESTSVHAKTNFENSTEDIMIEPIKKRKRRANDDALYTLTARAYDLGVPHLSSVAKIMIIAGVAMEARIMMFIVQGEQPDSTKTAASLAAITGGRVTVLETRPYVQQNYTGSPGTLPPGGKKSIIVARVEQTEAGAPLVDVEKIRETLAANGVGIIAGTETIMNATHVDNTKPPVDGTTRHATDGQATVINNTITTVQNEEVTVYKAENKLLFWLLIILGLLMLMAIAALIICCICPGCPFYMAPRKRRVHSSETLVVRTDGRPKRHLHRQPAAAAEVSWNGRKQAWSADPRHWQFNKRNVKNCSLPGDVAHISGQPNEVQMNIETQRLRDGVAYDRRSRVNEQERMYMEDMEDRKARAYGTAELDSLQRHEMDRGSDLQHQSFRQRFMERDMNGEPVREQHFYREGNAEVLRLVTRGQVEDTSHPHHHHRPTLIVDGKDIILQRFIEDQNSRHDISMQDIEAARSMESHQRPKEVCQQQPPEIILIPDRLDLGHRQHIEEIGPNVQRLVIDHGDYGSQKMERESLRQEKQEAAAGVTERQPIATKESGTQYLHDLELARQNALLTRLLLERESRRAGAGAAMDSASYLETQSLPGQVAIATQTDKTAATQTDRHIKSRSDNDESDEESRHRRKLKSRKKYADGDWRRSRTLWMKSPIEEEGSPCFDKRLNILRKKVKEVKEGRISLEPEVLREISDSLDGNGSSCKGDEEETMRRYRKSTEQKTSISYKVLNEKESGSQSSEEMRKGKRQKSCGDVTDDQKQNVTESTTSPEMKVQREKHEKTVKTPRKEAKSKTQQKSEGMMKPSFRILEKEFTMLTKKLSKLGEKKFQESTASDSTSQEKSDSYSKEVKRDSDQKTSRKPEATSSQKQASESTAAKVDKKEKLKKESAIAKTKQKLKYQQSQVMSTGSSEYDDAFDKPKKSTGPRQETVRPKQSTSTQGHAKVRRLIDRRELKKQMAESRDESSEKKKETSKDGPKYEKGKMTTRAPKLVAISRKPHVDETSTSTEEKKVERSITTKADFGKKSSTDFSDTNGTYRRKGETLIKKVIQRFSDDFVEEPQKETADRKLKPTMGEDQTAKSSTEQFIASEKAEATQLSESGFEKIKDSVEKPARPEEHVSVEETMGSTVREGMQQLIKDQMIIGLVSTMEKELPDKEHDLKIETIKSTEMESEKMQEEAKVIDVKSSDFSYEAKTSAEKYKAADETDKSEIGIDDFKKQIDIDKQIKSDSAEKVEEQKLGVEKLDSKMTKEMKSEDTGTDGEIKDIEDKNKIDFEKEKLELQMSVEQRSNGKVDLVETVKEPIKKDTESETSIDDKDKLRQVIPRELSDKKEDGDLEIDETERKEMVHIIEKEKEGVKDVIDEQEKTTIDQGMIEKVTSKIKDETQVEGDILLGEDKKSDKLQDTSKIEQISDKGEAVVKSTSEDNEITVQEAKDRELKEEAKDFKDDKIAKDYEALKEATVEFEIIDELSKRAESIDFTPDKTVSDSQKDILVELADDKSDTETIFLDKESIDKSVTITEIKSDRDEATDTISDDQKSDGDKRSIPSDKEEILPAKDYKMSIEKTLFTDTEEISRSETNDSEPKEKAKQKEDTDLKILKEKEASDREISEEIAKIPKPDETKIIPQTSEIETQLKIQDDHKEDISTKISSTDKDNEMEKDSSKILITQKEGDNGISVTEIPTSTADDTEKKIHPLTVDDHTIEKDTIFSDRDVSDLLEKKLVNGKESTLEIDIEHPPTGDKILEKGVTQLPSGEKDKSETEISITDTVESLTSKEHQKSSQVIEQQEDDKIIKDDIRKDTIPTDDKLVTERDTAGKIDIPAELKRGESGESKEIDDSLKGEISQLALGERADEKEIGKPLRDPTASLTEAADEKTKAAAEKLLEETLEASTEPRNVPDNETIDEKLAQTPEKEEPGKASGSFKGNGSLETCSQTFDGTEKEKFAFDSITRMGSTEISELEKRSESASGRTESQEVEQFVEGETFSVKGDQIKPVLKEQCGKDVEPMTVGDEMGGQVHVTEKKMDRSVYPEEVEREEPVEEYADVSLPHFTSIIDTVDDSEDSDTSSDLSRKTTLTTRPYHTPRHRVRQFSDREGSEAVEIIETQSAEEEDTKLTIKLTGDETVETTEGEVIGKDHDTSVESSMETIESARDKDEFSEEDRAFMPIQSPFRDGQVMPACTDVRHQIKQEKLKSDPIDKESSVSEADKESLRRAKDLRDTKTSDTQEKPSVSKPPKAGPSKATGRKTKEVQKRRIFSQRTKKGSSEESSEEKTHYQESTTSQFRYRARKKTSQDQSTQKDKNLTKQSRRAEDESQRRQMSRPRVDKDKKPSSSGEKHPTPPKTGEIDTSRAQPKYMAWYKKNREEMERKRAELMATDDEEQLPRWLRRSMRSQKEAEDKKSTADKADTTPRTRRKVKPLVNVESEQLKAIVRQGRKLRRAEGGKNEDPPVQIFATTPPALPQTDPKHHLVQHSEYKYEKVPVPFYLHPPPAPHPSPQLSPEHFEIPQAMDRGRTDEDFDSGIAVSLQGGNRLRHQQLLEKKSVFDIAYSEAAPSQLRSDSTTPPS